MATQKLRAVTSMIVSDIMVGTVVRAMPYTVGLTHIVVGLMVGLMVSPIIGPVPSAVTAT